MRRTRSARAVSVLRILRNAYGEDSMLEQLRGDGPFQVLIATILSARSRDERTIVVARELFKRYPTSAALAKAKRADVQRIIKTIGFYRAKSAAIINASRMLEKKYHGAVPDTYEALVSLPGVGRKVAGCVLVYAHGQSAIPVDIHVHRISNRLGWVRTKDPEETERKLLKLIPKPYWRIVNECMVSHGRNTCRPIGPKCGQCPVTSYCAYGRRKTIDRKKRIE